jgi:hypothetical protein
MQIWFLFRTCVDYDYDFAYDVGMSTYDQYQAMNTYFDKHEMVMLEEETSAVEVVALDMDHHMHDNKLDHCK